MYKRKYTLLFCVSILLSVFSFAQVQRGHYCSCIKASTLKELNKYYQDSLYSTYQEDTSGIAISIINTTMDTLYVFRSYLEKEFLSSKYLHRINRKERKYKLSLLPLVPHVFTKYSDVITDEPIVGNQQIVYDFFKLPPNSVQSVLLSYEDLFKKKGRQNNVSKDYDVKMLNKYTKKIPQKFCTVKKLKDKYSFEIEFAVYKSVNLLCNEAAYFLQENEFDKQSKDFKILTIGVEMKNYNY
jgi:hypothetical protein